LPEWSFLWLAMELTGLNSDIAEPLEIAVAIGDVQALWAPIWHALAKPSQPALDLMDSWNVDWHQRSGLLTQAHEDGIPLSDVDRKLSEFIAMNAAGSTVVPVAAAVGRDVNVLRRACPRTHALLHYRVVDLDAFRLTSVVLGLPAYQRQGPLRAIDDVSEAIQEFRHYAEILRPASS
jgi:oligoribonuclease (3'-5' exoribonuclease)